MICFEGSLALQKSFPRTQKNWIPTDFSNNRSRDLENELKNKKSEIKTKKQGYCGQDLYYHFDDKWSGVKLQKHKIRGRKNRIVKR